MELFRDEVFLRTAWNSVVYTVVAVALKFVLGLTMALILDQERRFNNFFRTLLFVPWAVPVVIVSLNWRWILRRPERLPEQLPDHLSPEQHHHLLAVRPALADGLRHRGRGVGRHAALLDDLPGRAAGHPRELYEAAEIDGASVVQQFFYVTVPRLRTIFLTTVMLSTIWTATNLQFVFVLTRGGPASRTEIFPHLAYMTALGARRLGMGAAVSLVFFPSWSCSIVLLTRRMLRPTGRLACARSRGTRRVAEVDRATACWW